MQRNARAWYSTVAVLVLLVVVGMSVQGGVRAAAGSERSQAASAGTVQVFPTPGATTVETGAQISFRGSGTGALGDVKVVGSSSGTHSGHWLLHSDGQGRSFVPDKPFTAGETVTVTTSAAIAGSSNGSFTYRIATPAQLTPDQLAKLSSDQPTPSTTAATGATAASQTAAAPTAAPKATATATAAPLATADAVAAPPTPTGAAGPYRSRPDLHPPAIATTSSSAAAPGLLFATQIGNDGKSDQGIEIYDNSGQPVYFLKTTSPTWLHPITFRGQPALVYFESILTAAQGVAGGDWVVLDNSYRVIARITAGNGMLAEEHELKISPDGTKALIDIYNPVRMDMSAYGGPVDATVLEGVVQEVDIATGAVTFEWHSLSPGNFPVTDSYITLSLPTLDYFHLNSIDYDTDGNYLFTARHVSVVGKINRTTGALMWFMGGKRNQFTFTDGDSGPSFPHDVQRRPDGTISVFDNGTGRNPPYSRGVVWQVDETAKTAHVTQQWLQPGLYGSFVGSDRLLPNGDQLISWGETGRTIEYQGQTPVFESQMAANTFTYRTVRADWHATPAQPPDLALDRGPGGVLAYASWNGATDVASWELWGGPDWSHLRRLTTAPKNGFETWILAPTQATDGVFQVRALDASGNTLGISGNVADPINAKYQALGGSASFLGAPTSGEYGVGSGMAEDFAGGTIYWSASTGAHEVHGAIGARYRAIGGPASALGFPTTDETGTTNGRGRYNNFQGGAVYWTAKAGAWELYGLIGLEWGTLGYSNSVLGFPTCSPTPTTDKVGQFQLFESGAIYSSPSTGPHEMHGYLFFRWLSLGAEQGSLGYPISDQINNADGSFGNFFQHGAIIGYPDGHYQVIMY